MTQHMTNSEPLTPSTEMTSMSSNATVDRLLRDGAALLRAAGVDLPEAVAGSLLASLQDAACATAPTSDNLDAAAISSTMADEFYRLVDRCARHEPLGYIVGHAWFRGLKLSVGPEVYAPKPETHALLDFATADLADYMSRNRSEQEQLLGADLCTGSGVVALTLATEVGNTEMIAVELDERAAAWAQKNVDAHASKLHDVGSNVRLEVCDVATVAQTALSLRRGAFDFVASNPPYVGARGPTDESIRKFAPAVAIDGGDDGLDVIRAVVSAACELLRPGGRLYIEHEDGQGFDAIDSGVPGLLEATGSFTAVEDIRDQRGRPRVAVATFG